MRAIKGFNDILPSVSDALSSQRWRALEAELVAVLDRFAYEEIRLPLVEETALFARAIGDDTDIVEKEMYTFFDKSTPPSQLTLRPEGTAGCVRAVLEHHLTRGNQPKLWYKGAMFRYEQPQKGRYRQFHQLGVESFGNALPDADAELIAITWHMWRRLGILPYVRLQLNSIGEPDERRAYRAALVAFLHDKKAQLDTDSQRRLDKNPLRILDSKDAGTQELLEHAPKLFDFLGAESKAHFAQVQDYLQALGIKFAINLKLVRGLDYYNKTVFEWTTDQLGAQATVCGGGRYDGLLGQIKRAGKDKVVSSEPAVGFAMGLERLLLLVDKVAPLAVSVVCDVFVVAQPSVYQHGLSYANALRDRGLRVKMASSIAMKSQMKQADKSGAKWAIIIGEQEVTNRCIGLKRLDTGEQQSYAMNDFLSQATTLLDFSVKEAQ